MGATQVEQQTQVGPLLTKREVLVDDEVRTRDNVWSLLTKSHQGLQASQVEKTIARWVALSINWVHLGEQVLHIDSRVELFFSMWVATIHFDVSEVVFVFPIKYSRAIYITFWRKFSAAVTI